MLWSLNDSGEPVIFALSATGAVRDRVRVTGARVEDWEDLAAGPCPSGACLYVADIGDNGARRRAITIYRVPEPSPRATRTAPAAAMRATYPDGPRDAEALVVLPDGAMLVVTKGDGGPVALYRFPGPFRAGATVVLERVAELVPATGRGRNRRVGRAQRITGASASPDGRWIVLRTGRSVVFHEARAFAAGRFPAAARLDLASAREPQGEGVALGANGALWLAGEGGERARPGTLARASCTLP